MKKNLFLALALLLSVSVFAQNNSFIINETFDSAEMPEGWYFMDEGADNFKINTTNNAGGDPNELYFKSSPIVTAGIHLVMGSADLTGIEALGLSFKHSLNNAQLSSTIGIATSSDNGTTWNTAWSQTFTGAASSGLYNVNETIKPADLGKSNVLFCLFYEGNTYNFNKWYFDDISIFPLSVGTDIQLSSIEVSNMIQAGEIEIGFIASNISGNEVTSFEASYEIEGYEVVTETFNMNIAPLQKQNVKFSKSVEFFPGTHEIKVNIISVNGEEDANTDNNSMTKEIRTFMKTIDRTPMIEHFSSSTCTPCVAIDNDMMSLTTNNKGRYTYVKYPWNYPGIGDKYYIADCGVRGAYYGVTGVPTIIFDGTTTTKQPKQSNFDERYNTTSYVDIIGAFDVNDNTINVTADIISYIDIPNVKVFATVNEKTTTGNVGTNGMTEFHHILMNMLSGVEGIQTSLEAGQYQRYEFTLDMETTNMEEIEDLEVAVWIQNYESKEVHNSRFLNEYTAHLYPVQNLSIAEKTINWEAPEQGTPVGYNVFVNNILVAEKITETSYIIAENGNAMIEVFALYENETTSVGVTLFAEIENGEGITDVEESQSISIYPNPANDRLFIEAESEINEVVVYTITGVIVGQQSTVNSQQTLTIDLSELKSGVYFVKIVTENGEMVKRFIKK